MDKTDPYFRLKLEHEKSSLEQSVYSNFLVSQGLFGEMIDYENGRAEHPALKNLIDLAEASGYEGTYGEFTQKDYIGAYLVDGLTKAMDNSPTQVGDAIYPPFGATSSARSDRYFFRTNYMKNAWNVNSILEGNPKTEWQIALDKMTKDNPFVESSYNKKQKEQYYEGVLLNSFKLSAQEKKDLKYLEDNPEIVWAAGGGGGDFGWTTKAAIEVRNLKKKIDAIENNNEVFKGVPYKLPKPGNVASSIQQSKMLSNANTNATKLNREAPNDSNTRIVVDVDQTILSTNNITVFTSPVKDKLGS